MLMQFVSVMKRLFEIIKKAYGCLGNGEGNNKTWEKMESESSSELTQRMLKWTNESNDYTNSLNDLNQSSWRSWEEMNNSYNNSFYE